MQPSPDTLVSNPASMRCLSLSKRQRAAGEIESAADFEQTAKWHKHLADQLKQHGNALVSESTVVHGEVASDTNGLIDTLADPDIIAIDSSEARGQMLVANDIVALSIDISKTAGASNTHEKLIAHEIALAHKTAMDQAAKAKLERDPQAEIRRLNLAARMMTSAQEGMLNLQKLRSTAPQKVIVQHVTVESGGQAVVGDIHN